MRPSERHVAASSPGSEPPQESLRAVAEAMVLTLTGRDAILPTLPLLQELARRSLQPGAADYVDHFLTQPYMGGKIPHLLLLGDGVERSAGELSPENLLGAVLLHQYQLAGVLLPVFVTEDLAGERNVLAPATVRSAVALRAVAHLLAGGANLVALTLRDAAFEAGIGTVRPPSKRARWCVVERTLRRRLLLSDTYDETLARLGAHTRRNLRYYRRRAEEQLGCTFVPDVRISEDEFVALNRVCSYPTPDSVARWRYRSAMSLSGGRMAAVCSRAGDWLSVAGGRSCSGTLSLDWQMNQTRFGSLSLSTVLRSYLIEHAVRSGIHTLLFEGGTPHSMQMSFQLDRVVDLAASREGFLTDLLCRYGGTILPQRNFLARTLSHSGTPWRPW